MTSTPTTMHRGPQVNRLVMIALVVLVAAAGVAAGFALGRRSGSGSSSGIQGSGTAATETRDVGPFSSVDLVGSNLVSITVGDARSVVVHADDNLIHRVTTTVESGRLEIGNHGSFTTHVPMRVDVTVPHLDGVTVEGSGTVTVAGVRSDVLTVGLPGSGVIKMSGTTDRLEATLDGSGDLLMGDLLAADVTALISGSGTIRLSVSRSLDASVTGSGAILYAGSPAEVSKSVTGSGTIAGSDR